MKRLLPFLPPAIILVFIFLILSFHPEGSQAMKSFFLAPLSNPLLLGRMLHQSAILLLPALGITLAFSAGLYNLGGEGQIYLGGTLALTFLLKVPHWPAPLAWTTAWLLASLGGAMLTGLSCLLKNRGGVHELISTYLISLGVTRLTDGWIQGPLKDHESYLMTTPPIAEAHQLSSWLPPSKLNGSLLVSLGLIIAVYIFLYRRNEGYFWRLSGKNPLLAQYAGGNVKTLGNSALLISGALHGLSGGLLITGTYFMGLLGFSAGNGWDGMAVALIADLHPLGILPASLFYSYLISGSENAQLQGFLSVNLRGFILALVFFLISSRWILQRRRRRKDAL